MLKAVRRTIDRTLDKSTTITGSIMSDTLFTVLRTAFIIGCKYKVNL